VVEQLNVLPAIRAAATRATRLTAVDRTGREIGWIPTQIGRRAMEVPRDELSGILASAGRELADFRYDETVLDLSDVGDGVEVSFERAAPGRFDLVVGADGLHSTVRRMVFGPETDFVTHLGLYVATAMLDRPSTDLRTVLIHNAPGRAVVIHPATGREGAAFIFRHPPLPAMTVRDPRVQDRLLTAAYGDLGWQVPQLLDRVLHTSDRYFDSVSRVRMDCWSRGRTVLVGDAATCVSLLGEGSSMAIAGAATLSISLVRSPDPASALRTYERVHRRRVRPHHMGATLAGHLLVPATRAGVSGRDTAFRAFGFAADAVGRRRRGPSSPTPG
jgi:2-polyprenyl-6-methoxyphenol hydroxylase-like FAD-dependent oxidoreductase